MKNYEAKLAELSKILGYNTLYCNLCGSVSWCSVTSRVIIDHSDHAADAVVERLIQFVDCMLEQIRRCEPGTTTDYFTLTADDERLQFDAAELVQDGDEPEWNRWQEIRTRFLNGRRLELEHQFISELSDDVYTTFGIPKLLGDLLEGGGLSQWVTLTVLQDNGDYGDWHEFRKPYHQDAWRMIQKQPDNYMPFHGQRFWMNGNFKGDYVCGEVPFVRDELAVMSVSSWYQSEKFMCDDNTEGIYLTLAPIASPEKLTKAETLARRFYSALPCTVEIKTFAGNTVRLNRLTEPVSREEELHRRVQLAEYANSKALVDVMDIQSQMEKASETCREASLKPPMTNEEEVRIWLERFALIRERFTDEEVETLLSKNVEIQELYTRHAAEKYTDEEIRLYRFGLCVYLIISASVRNGIFKDPTIPPETMGYPLELFEKVDALPEALKKNPEHTRGYQSDFVGMNDLSSRESSDAYRLYYDGYFFRVFDICLNSAKDLETLENLLNEVSAFEEELRRDHVEWSEQYDDTDERRSLYEASCFGCDLEYLWNCLLPEDDPQQSRRRIPVVTNREFLEYVRRTGDCAMDTDQILDDDVYFESMDMGTHARLRFRRENGRYHHEISMMD